jgi:glutamyl-tRNA synthetase
LNWQVPQFSHLPLILGPDRQRLSKRHGATSVEEFQEEGILPEALFNYLCLLGWSPGDDTEIMSREVLIERFSLDRANKANTVFDQQKLIWMNSKYLAGMPAAEILEKIRHRLKPGERTEAENTRDSFIMLLELLKPRSQTLLDFLSASRFYFEDPGGYEEQAVWKYFTETGTADLLTQLADVLAGVDSFKADLLEKNIRKFAEQQKLNAGRVIHPLRLALTGRSSSPGIFEILEVLGRKKALRRIGQAVEYIKALRYYSTGQKSTGQP